MDGRNKIRRPRTQQDPREVTQVQGWTGVDAIGQRTQTPVRTFETPLVYFPADITIGASQQLTIPLPPRCYQLVFIDVVPGAWASFNGGGARKIKDGFSYSGEFLSLEVLTDATGGFTLQMAAY